MTGPSAECHAHTTPFDSNEGARGLGFAKDFDEATVVIHLKRWLCIGCGIEAGNKILHMDKSYQPRCLRRNLTDAEKEAAIGYTTTWTAEEIAEIKSL